MNNLPTGQEKMFITKKKKKKNPQKKTINLYSPRAVDW